MSSVRSALLKSAELHLPRRGFLGLLTGALVMPAIIKVAPLMRIKTQPLIVSILNVGTRAMPVARMMWYSDGEWRIDGFPISEQFPPLLDPLVRWS